MSESAEPRTALEVVRAIVTDLADALETAISDARAGSPTGIHDIRTTISRSRAVLAAFREVLARDATDEVRERLADIAHRLEPARTAEVRLGLAEASAGDAPSRGTESRALDELVADSSAARDAASAAAMEALESSDVDEVIAMLRGVVDRPPLGEGFAAEPRRTTRQMLRRQLRRAVRRLKAVDENDLDSLHDARKAVRRFRHVAEAILGGSDHLLGAKWKKTAKRAKGLQDAAGDHRDAQLYAEHLESKAASTALDGGDAFGYGALAGAERARADELLVGFRAARKRFLSSARAK